MTTEAVVQIGRGASTAPALPARHTSVTAWRAETDRLSTTR